MMHRFFYTLFTGYLVLMGIMAEMASPVAGDIVGPCVVGLVYVFDKADHTDHR